MFFLFQLLESIKLIKRIQTSRNYFLLFLVEYILLFIETNDFSLGFLLKRLGLFLLIPKHLSFSFKGFLLENFGYLVDLANIVGLVLTNILGILYVLNIARSDILLLILFIASTRGYVSFTSFGYHVTKGDKTTIVMFGWYNKKERNFWFSSEISYVVFKRRDNANREGNNVTNVYVTRGP
jgi:hypothetical protein